MFPSPAEWCSSILSTLPVLDLACYASTLARKKLGTAGPLPREGRAHPLVSRAAFNTRLRQIQVSQLMLPPGDRLAVDLQSVVARASIAVEAMRGWCSEVNPGVRLAVDCKKRVGNELNRATDSHTMGNHRRGRFANSERRLMFDVANSASQHREQKEPQRDPKKSEFLSEQFSPAWMLFFGPNSAPSSRRILLSNLARSPPVRISLAPPASLQFSGFSSSLREKGAFGRNLTLQVR